MASIQELEGSFAEQVGASHAIAVFDLRTALDLVLQVCDLRAGAELVTSPMSWPWTLDVILKRKLVPRYAPIRPTDLNLDPAQLDSVLPSARPVVLVPHFAGAPAPLAEIAARVEPRGGVVIQEGSFALGASFGEHLVGSFGICIFALHGADRRVDRRGAVVAVDDERFASALRDACRRRDAGLGPELALFGMAGMRKERTLRERRMEIGRIYDLEFAAREIEGVQVIHAGPPGSASRLYYPLLVRQRRRLAEALLRDWSVEVDVPQLVLPRSGEDCWISAAARLIGLPIHVEMESRDAERVVDALLTECAA